MTRRHRDLTRLLAAIAEEFGVKFTGIGKTNGGHLRATFLVGGTPLEVIAGWSPRNPWRAQRKTESFVRRRLRELTRKEVAA
jgi:hypothetical protein